MMRMWIGLALLIAVVFSGLWAADAMEQAHLPSVRDLNQAAQQALENDWETAAALTARAKAGWEKKRVLTAALSEHEPMESVDALFAQLEVYEKARDQISYGAACVCLARQLEYLGRCHSFSLVNLM